MKSLLFIPLFTVSLSAQPANLSARDLFFTPTPVSASTSGSVVSAPQNQPMGLRYSLLRSNSDGTETEVRTDTVFRSGDRIRLTAEANQTGFLYIIHQGSSGEWFVLEGSPVSMEKNKRTDVPSGGRFFFDDRAGEERLFLVFLRQRDPSLDRILQGLPPEPATPAKKDVVNTGRPAHRSVDPVLMSSISLQSRDLIFEKVDDPPSKPKAEKAAYVVNPGTTNETRVVVDLRLQHR
jgi:hypothetical protein